MTNYTKQELLNAQKRLSPYIHKTPVLQSRLINELAGCELFFKCENFQKAGAFKMRGAMHKILSLSKAEQSHGVATHSSGNFGQALALSAKTLGINASIVMPQNSPQVKKDAVRAYGAQIIESGNSPQSREETLKNFLSSCDATECHPYNDKQVILGNSTATQELVESYDLDDIIAPLGGGGLLSGTLLATKFFAPKTKVYGAEPSGADNAFRSIRDGEIYPSLNPNTVADGLRTSLGTETYSVIKENVTEILLVDDQEILNAMKLIWERMKIIIEPSSAITLASVIKNKALFKGRKVGLIISGGNVDLKSFFKINHQLF
ncbi:MAG: pyridoxal-phosphate dependent enzyme [Bacteroidales bacterium]|nr:pyridoxal-phosphate dependent enzyme [Bacteroidales bacterium]